jgi:hypothetical protein
MKTEELVDTFATQIDPAVWGTYGEATWESGRLRCNSTTAYAGAYTLGSYDFRESFFLAQVVAPPAAASRETTITISGVSGYGAAFAVLNSPRQLMMRRKQAANSDTFLTYDPVAHAWLRVRLTGTTLGFDTSPDGVTWTQRRSITTTADLAAAQIEMSVGQWAAEADIQPGYFDNINSPPVVATGWPKVWTGSAWTKKPAKVWTGSAWVQKPVKVWTGSTWKTVT